MALRRLIVTLAVRAKRGPARPHIREVLGNPVATLGQQRSLRAVTLRDLLQRRVKRPRLRVHRFALLIFQLVASSANRSANGFNSSFSSVRRVISGCRSSSSTRYMSMSSSSSA